LTSLSASRNRLATLPQLPPTLHRLTLAGNLLEDLPPWLADCSSLTRLDVSQNPLRNVASPLPLPPSLQSLALSHTQLPPRALASLVLTQSLVDVAVVGVLPAISGVGGGGSDDASTGSGGRLASLGLLDLLWSRLSACPDLETLAVSTNTTPVRLDAADRADEPAASLRAWLADRSAATTLPPLPPSPPSALFTLHLPSLTELYLDSLPLVDATGAPTCAVAAWILGTRPDDEEGGVHDEDDDAPAPLSPARYARLSSAAPFLRVLCLSSCGLQSLPCLADADFLETLHLEDNAIDAAALDRALSPDTACLPSSLSHLYLTNNRVTSVPASLSVTMPALVTLDLVGNPLDRLSGDADRAIYERCRERDVLLPHLLAVTMATSDAARAAAQDKLNSVVSATQAARDEAGHLPSPLTPPPSALPRGGHPWWREQAVAEVDAAADEGTAGARRLPQCLGVSEMVGRRPTQEDALLATPPIVVGPSVSVSLLAVADGHAGDAVAHFVAGALAPTFLASLARQEAADGAVDVAALAADPAAADQLVGHLHRCLLDTLSTVSACLALYHSLPLFPSESLHAGTTLAAVAIVTLPADRSFVVCANVGDARTLLVCRSGPPLRLSVDHKPGGAEERDAVRSRPGGWTAGRAAPRLNGTLGVSRSLGDLYLAPSISDEPSSVALEVGGGKVRLVTVDRQDKQLASQVTSALSVAPDVTPAALVLGCDGVFDELKDEQVAMVVLGAEEERRAEEGDRAQQDGADGRSVASRVARRIRDAAFAAGSDDNISVIVRYL